MVILGSLLLFISLLQFADRFGCCSYISFTFTGIFERFRGILHEGEIDKRVQFLIEGLFAIRKAKFQVGSLSPCFRLKFVPRKVIQDS